VARLPGDPTRGQWVRYALGGRLPDAQRDWVRHDLTDAGWRWRLLRRVAVQLAVPLVVAVVAALALDPLAGVLLVLLLLLTSLGISAMVADQIRDRRLHQHGLAVPRDPDADYRDRRRW